MGWRVEAEGGGGGLGQDASHLGLNLSIGVREQLDQSAVQLGGLVQHDPEETILLPPQLLRHLGGRPPRLQVPCERQQPQQDGGGCAHVEQQHDRGRGLKATHTKYPFTRPAISSNPRLQFPVVPIYCVWYQLLI